MRTIEINGCRHRLLDIARDIDTSPRTPPRLTITTDPWTIELAFNRAQWFSAPVTQDPIALTLPGQVRPGKFTRAQVAFEDGTEQNLAWPNPAAPVSIVTRTPPSRLPAAQVTPAVRNQPETASPSRELEAEILRIASSAFASLTAAPTMAQFYQRHVIEGTPLVDIARGTKWKLRTLKSRKTALERYLTETFGMAVDLDAFRAARRRSGRIVPTDPGIIERTHAGPSGNPWE